VKEPIDVQAKVQDVMSFPVHVVTADTYFKDIAAQLQRHRVSALPVVDADQRLIGVVSEADLILKEEQDLTEKVALFESRSRRHQRSKALGLTARQVMTSPVVTVGPETSIARAARLMRERRVKRLPVVDADGLVLGIVSRGDLLKLFLRDDDAIRCDISELITRTWPGSTGVEITVRAGMVVLTGVVERRSDVELLSDLTKRTDGVVDVQNLLTFRIDDKAPKSDLPPPWLSYGLTGRPHID
jgi:CBS domain-containing protein